MVREGKVVRSRTDYLLGADRILFRNVSVRPFYGGGLLTQHPRERAYKIHQGKEEIAATATHRANKGGRDLCGHTEGRAKIPREGPA